MRRRIQLIVFAVLIASWAYLLSQTAYAATTVIVDSAADDPDADLLDGICADASGQCTLRAAIQTLNAEGPDAMPHQIQFDIAGSGPFTITPTSPLPAITVPLLIDGTSQPGASCPTSNAPANLMIVLDGSNAGTGADGLVLGAGSDGSLVQGLVIGNFDDGIDINSDDNQARSNHIGVQADGVSPMGNSNGLLLSGARNEIGGSNTHASRNVISANQSHGILFSAFGVQNSVVNNFIGTTSDGLGDLGNGASGLYISGNDNLIGGNSSIARNVISGNDGSGIHVYLGSGNIIVGNHIGTARGGMTPLPNDQFGIYLLGGAVANVIGSTISGEGNRIAYNGHDGVVAIQNPTGVPERNEVRGNAIYNNGDLGIDLGNDGVDANDVPGDGDGGENERQNYPVLLSATDGGTISGTLDSQANTEYRIDFYRSLSCDPSGHGEGQEYLATGTVTTDGDGYADFEINSPSLSVSPGNSITATATDPDGNTSEFSACVTVEASTLTPTPTNTATPGLSPTATNTPTATSTSTPTHTATPGPSPTSTNTAIPGPSPTATLTAEPPAAPTHSIYLPVVIRGK